MNSMMKRYRNLLAGEPKLVLAVGALFVTGVTILGWCAAPSMPSPPPSPVTPTPAVVTEQPQAAMTPKMSPEYAWAAAQTFLFRAASEDEKAIAEAGAAMDAFFAERQAGATAFAEAVLSLDGKTQAAVNMTAEILNGVSELFGQGKAVPQDQLMQHIRRCFMAHVLNEGQLRQAIDAAAAGYAARVRESESRLVVVLRTDLADDAFGLTDLAPVQVEAESIRQLDTAFGNTFDTAAGDLLMSMGKFVASWVGGDLLSKGILGDDAHPAVRFGGDLAAGALVEQGLDAATDAMGYKPREKTAENARRILADIQRLVLLGDENVEGAYFPLLNLAAGHPDETVRSECAMAVAAMETRGHVGLLRRLHRLSRDRERCRAAVIYRQIYGADAQLPAEILPPAVDPEQAPPASELIEVARRWCSYYGG